MYYLQSRYYDPAIGRFINADGLVSTGQGILGNNMYAYCGNNPVNSKDPEGRSWKSFWNGVKSLLKNLKTKASSNKDGTRTKGINLSGAFGAGGSVSFGLTTDKKGNLGVSVSVAGGGGFPSAGVSAYISETTAPTIYKQKGMGTQVGGSVSGGITVGAEYTLMVDKEANEAYHGVTVMAGIGVAALPAEMHGEVGNTWVWGVNIYDVALQVVDWVSPSEP